MLKVGDKVAIKSAGEIKEIENHNYGPGFGKKMEEYCNKLAKIVEMDNHGEDLGEEWVYLDIDGSCWSWDAKWLEKPNIIQLDNNLFEI